VDLVIREYRPEDCSEWVRVHAIILSTSHAWNYTIQERPNYEPNESTQLVALVDGHIIGMADVQYDRTPGELCYVKDSRGGYVLEFGRLPEFAGSRIGSKLIEAMIEDAKRKGIRRLEFWSQDRTAQRFYRRMQMKEISRHYRFRMKPPEDVRERLSKDYVGIEYIYGVCVPDEWPLVKEKFDIIEKPPLEPHLCVGFEVRF
jgi:ribosomal protein S18 acetylase RimI-like enzyme